MDCSRVSVRGMVVIGTCWSVIWQGSTEGGVRGGCVVGDSDIRGVRPTTKEKRKKAVVHDAKSFDEA